MLLRAVVGLRIVRLRLNGTPTVPPDALRQQSWLKTLLCSNMLKTGYQVMWQELVVKSRQDQMLSGQNVGQFEDSIVDGQRPGRQNKLHAGCHWIIRKIIQCVSAMKLYIRLYSFRDEVHYGANW
jgi:hypothetical protein